MNLATLIVLIATLAAGLGFAAYLIHSGAHHKGLDAARLRMGLGFAIVCVILIFAGINLYQAAGIDLPHPPTLAAGKPVVDRVVEVHPKASLNLREGYNESRQQLETQLKCLQPRTQPDECAGQYPQKTTPATP